jgi:putative FmdB family regulatory protein
MPVYDYLCAACGHLLEVVHGIQAEGPRFCPSCGVEGRMKKAIASPTVLYRGSGWAKRDRSIATRSREKAATAADGKAGRGASDDGRASKGSPAKSANGSEGGSTSTAGSASTASSASTAGSTSTAGSASGSESD